MLEHYRRALDLFVGYEDWYPPEAVLAFFKIPELAVSLYSSDLTDVAKKAARQLFRNFLQTCFNEGSDVDTPLKSSDLEAESMVISVLTSNTMTQRRKVLYALEQLELTGLRLRHYVGEIVRMRNRLAHVEPISFRRWEYPLPPFLVCPEDLQELAEFSKALARTVIARLLNIHPSLAVVHSLDEALNDLPPSSEEVVEFMNDNPPFTLSADFFEASGEVSSPGMFKLEDLLCVPDSDTRVLPYLGACLDNSVRRNTLEGCPMFWV